MMDEYKRFFVAAQKGKQGKLGKFRSKYTKRVEDKLRKRISKQQKALKDIGYGYPFFSINGFKFGIGTETNPSWDLESIPKDLNSR